MFNLIYRDGAPENTGHYEVWPTDGLAGYKLGQTVHVNDGKAVLCGGDGDAYRAYGIVAKDADKNDETVLVLRATEDMIFKCPITGTAIDKCYKGQMLTVGEDCGSVASSEENSSASAAVEVVDLLDAKKSGDFIEVRFNI